MSVALWVGRKHFEVGSVSFLKAFFSTAFARLERENWGALYPLIMRDLYSGRLAYERAEVASRELEQIRTALAEITPDQVVWDFEDPNARPPWGSEISPEIKSLADYFITSDGKNFLDVLTRALEEAKRAKRDLEIR